MKKLLCMLLIICITSTIFVAAPASAATSGTCGDNLTWILDDEGTLTISGEGDMYNWSYYSDAPWYTNRSSIVSVVVSDGVTSIGKGAFYECYSLSSVTIPDSVTTIGDDAFYYCRNLSTITIGKGVTNIGDDAFSSCTNLTDVYILDIATWCNIEFVNIWAHPLNYAENLYLNNELVTDLVIPDSVTSIGGLAFYKCDSLTSITIPDSVTTIGNGAFYQCYSLTSVTIPDSVTTIGDDAFYQCYSLSSITMPDSVTTIGDGAFSECSSLSSITIPDSVTTIGDGAFSECYSLSSIIVADKNLNYCSENGVLLNKSKTVLIKYPQGDAETEYTIPNSVTTIGNGAFSECHSLSSIIIPNSVTTIGDSAFYYCGDLSSIIIPNSVTTIGDRAFYNCAYLSSITIPDSVTTIGNGAFDSTGYYQNTENWDNKVLYIDNYLIEAETTLSGEYTVKSGTRAIADNAFDCCDRLSSITIPDSVINIGDDTFPYCNSLSNVIIGNGVTSIGDNAFSSLENLSSIIIGNSVTTIGDSAFSHCYSLTRINIPDSVTTIGDSAFYYCGDLSSITIPDSVTTIGNSAFSCCESLTSITLPNSITSIGSSAFFCCESLTSITLPNSVTSIGNSAFLGCDSLNTIYYTGDKSDWDKISIGYFHNEPLYNAEIFYNHISDANKIEESYTPTSTTLANDGKITEVEIANIAKNYPKHTTIRPKATNNSASLVGDWEVKNTTVETGEINSGVTISLSGDLIVENAVFKVTKGTTMNARSLKIGTNGRVIVDGTLNISGNISLYGGSGKVSGGYLEINRSNPLFDVTVATCNNLSISDYGYITVNGRLDINGNMEVATKSTASNYTNEGSIWLRGNLTQKKGGMFADGNNFCPKEKFKLILDQNVSSAVHKLNFDSPKKSYINDLYIVKGTYDNFHDGNATIYGAVKKIIPSNNDKGYIFEETTAEFKREQNKWNAEFNELFNTISSKTAGYVDLATNQSYFKKEFGEDTYKALRAYFGVLCLSMEVDPPSSFGYIGQKKGIPHYVKFFNSAENKWMNGNFTVDALDIAQISGTRTISYKCKDGETRIFCTLMYGNIEPLGEQLMNLVASNCADYYTDILGTTVNAFNKEPQKYIAKLLWEGVAHTKIPGLKDVTKSAIQDFVTAESFQKFVAETCNYNPSKTTLLSVDDTSNDMTINLFSEETQTEPTVVTVSEGEEGIFADGIFEAAVRQQLGITADDELTTDMLTEITLLSLPEQNISSIKGIEYMTSLTKLDLNGNALTDISYLSELTSLTEINLNGNNIYDISALKNLTSLKKLMLNSNYISDLAPVASLTSLQVLDTGNNRIQDISPLENLVNMKQLNIAYNTITSLDKLGQMTSLRVLYAQNNSLTDISGVAACPLTYVNLSNNSITDISALEEIEISELNLSNNAISDISPLIGNTNITSLVIEGTDIDDTSMSVIATMTALTQLSVQNTAITDITSFSALTSLKELSVANTSVTDLSPLESIYTLTKLDISDNDISDLSFAASLTSLEELYADNCGFTDSMLAVLNNLRLLNILSLSSNHISNIDFASTLTGLTYLDLSNNVNVSEESIDEIRTLFENNGNTFIYTIPNIAVTNIFMDSEEETIYLGSKITDFAHIYPYNATEGNVIYFSSDDSVATYENNVLTPVSEGTATVTAQNMEGDIIAECNITVKLGASKALIKSAKINGNTFTTEIKSLNSADMENANIILGIYNENNILNKSKLLNACISANSSASYTIENIDIDDDDSYYKVFIWDNTLCPLSNIFESEFSKSFEVDIVLESEHPYSSNIDETKEYIYGQGCNSIDVTFSDDTETENGYDYIYIYDVDNNLIGSYCGTALAGQTITVPGNTIKIRLTSDSSVTYYGYKTEKIVINK